ncbi:HAD-like protein [Trichoderma citrinoviride]|uniref:HAD-like protein n=1 Tax=Trichoderma citrinoviride TaxID=58853 RepID=A0A2T4B842_9HYPO|nr:HAD-like protein [Trichoderma citrinoviride]PTB65496.1 HAD-like protein [Trichoderma citrinoviride]
MASFDLTSYKALSFDIYATLIDWESGIFSQFLPLLGKLPKHHTLWDKSLVDVRGYLLKQYSAHEHALEVQYPDEKYSVLLSKVYENVAGDLGIVVTHDEAKAFGGAIGRWPAFADTVAAMQTLGKYYKLIALSNVDKASFKNTLENGLRGVEFDAIYVAEDIGTYKPNPNNFNYLVQHARQDFGIEKHEICHTAQSLTFDHIPIASLGFPPAVWISRGGGSMGMGDIEAVKDKVNIGATYETLGDMAADVELAFGKNKE